MTTSDPIAYFYKMQKSTFSIEDALSSLDIRELNDMQKASIATIPGADALVLLANTGTGKTLAFLLPVTKLLDRERQTSQALVIVPTRELALQIEQVFKKMSSGFKITCCYGGHLRETEENNLKQAPAIIVGTPGRLADHIRRGNISTTDIQTLVLDEFDKLLEQGFEEELSFIIGSIPHLKKRILISATEAVDIPAFTGMKDPVVLHFVKGEALATLEVQTLASPDEDKLDTLFKLLCMIGDRSAIVFCNQREFVEQVSAFLKNKGITNEFYHGAMEQQERDSALCKFRNGSTNVLVTTDLAARGLDINNIRYIIHYQLPHTEEAYIHRNGRTARMNASGTVVLIKAPHERVPEYIEPAPFALILPATTVLPPKPSWSTLFIGAGKKDKVNKVDIVGFLTHKGKLKKDDIGLIEVKDFFSFVAVRKKHVGQVLLAIKNEKIKNKKVKIDLAK